MIIDSHWFALCLSQGPVRLDGVTYYLRNGRVCVRPSHHKKRGKRSEAELATTGRFVEMRKLWTMYRRAVGELPVWRVAAREVGAGQGDTLFHRLECGVCAWRGRSVGIPGLPFCCGVVGHAGTTGSMAGKGNSDVGVGGGRRPRRSPVVRPRVCRLLL